MTTRLFGDTETYCESPLKHGTYQYAEKCELMLTQWAIDDDPVGVWDLTTPAEIPPLLEYGIESSDEYWFHNSMFDRSVIRLSTNARHRMGDNAWRQLCELERWRDTMVLAYCHALPGGLEKLGQVMKIPLDQQKLASGKELMMLFCKPRPKGWKIQRATRETHPKEWAEFSSPDGYAGHDILSMRAAFKKITNWNYV